MSFSSLVKKELCDIEINEISQMKAQCYGMLIQGTCSADEISLTTEKKETAMCLAQLLAQLTGVFCDVSNLNRKKLPSSQYIVRVPDSLQRLQIINYFGIRPQAEHLNMDNINDEHAAFIRGIFLTGGTVSNPEKDYHLEMTVQNPDLVGDILRLLKEVSLAPKIIVRSMQHVLYYKESEKIEDILTLMGAVNASMSVMDAKILKDLRNRANRLTNCETANIEKTVAASVKQIEAIKKIERKIGIASLPEDLRETARLRLENPEMSLNDLANNLSISISRSGVNHRLKRICAIADGIFE